MYLRDIAIQLNVGYPTICRYYTRCFYRKYQGSSLSELEIIKLLRFYYIVLYNQRYRKNKPMDSYCFDKNGHLLRESKVAAEIIDRCTSVPRDKAEVCEYFMNEGYTYSAPFLDNVFKLLLPIYVAVQTVKKKGNDDTE